MKHSQVRTKIVETASSLFYQNGYNSTGINEIIAESGIAKATLYNHFKSKEDICLAYLQYKNAIFLNDIKKYCESKPEGKAQILAIFGFLNRFFKSGDFNGCWCINTISEIPKENVRIRAEIQGQKKTLIKWIKTLVGSNLQVGTGSDVNKMAKQIYLLYEGAVAESHLHQSKWPIVEAKDLCASILG